MTSGISLGILDTADTFQRMEIYVFSIALSSGLLCWHVAKDKMISHKIHLTDRYVNVGVSMRLCVH